MRDISTMWAKAEVAARLVRKGFSHVSADMMTIALAGDDNLEIGFYWPSEIGPIPEGLEAAFSTEVARVLLGMPEEVANGQRS